MNAQWFFGSVLAVIVMFIIGLPQAAGQSHQGWQKGAPRYNPDTEIAVRGTIEHVREQPGRGGWNGTHLSLRVGGTVVDVHLGPSAYLAEQKITLAAGDRIEVTGSKVDYEGAEALIAREIRNGDKIVTLRDAQGTPRWAGRQRRSAGR